MITIVDVGAAFLGEKPPYQTLLDSDEGYLIAFEADKVEADKLRSLNSSYSVIEEALGDGREHTLYICPPGLGMSSLFEPNPSALGLFNKFPEWGKIVNSKKILTKRLADITDIESIDFLKMDVQGSELMILQNSGNKLDSTVVIQLEVSFIPLYKNQPSFGEIDIFMRSKGFIPHCFTNVKTWSIAPLIRNGEPRYPWNQLLEADIVYIKDLTKPDEITTEQLQKLSVIASKVYNSPDLAERCRVIMKNR
jgi:FkbM family methyltransferase